MVTSPASHFDQVLEEILEATADRTQAPTVDKVFVGLIERMVRQCHALLRQDLEYRVKSDPGLYSKDRIEDVLQKFETAIPDINEAITARVTDSVSELIRQDVRRVLQDALTDVQEAMEDHVSEEVRGGELPSTTGEGIHQIQEGHPSLERSGSQRAANERPELAGGPTGTPEKDEMRQHSTPSAPSAEAKIGEQDPDRPLNDDDEVYEGDVRLGLESPGGPKQMVRFLDYLSGNPQMRVIRMVGNYQSATVWLALRRPLRLKEIFYRMESVSKVRVSRPRGYKGPEHALEIVLEGLPEVVAVR